MDKVFIKRVNKFMRDSRPNFKTDNLCDIFYSGDLLEIGFLSRQCRNDLAGSCLMCDYGRTEIIGTCQEYIDEMDDILSKYNNGVKYLLLCSNGSILDEYQIPMELLKNILSKAQNCNIPEIIIETHYLDVSEEKLNLIKGIIQKPVTIEMGLETINPIYQDAFFMKGIELKRYEKTISLIQRYGYNVELNLMFGLPFLSLNEQIDDAKKTIDWICLHGCAPVIFPVNIKPYTILKYIYDKKMYKPISLWALVFLLDVLNQKQLSKIIVAWYGNRENSYLDNTSTIFPLCCNKCHDAFFRFFRLFLETERYDLRKKLISDFLASNICDCKQQIKAEIKQNYQTSFEENYNKFYESLLNDFNKF